MKKRSTIDAFFKRTNVNIQTSDEPSNPSMESNQLDSEDRPIKSIRVEIKEGFDMNSLEHDPGVRQKIWEHPTEKRDEVRRAYIKVGPYQCMLSKYSKSGENSRCFQPSWFKLFPSWLEYSPSVDVAFCLPCFLFHNKNGPRAFDTFIVNGFRSWKKVRDGKHCAFLVHIGKDITSTHRNAERACTDLMNQPSHIARRFQNFTSQEIAENRLRLRASIESTRWLVLQGSPFRGHDESKTSDNRGKFLELLSFVGSFDGKVAEVLDKAPRNAPYTSPTTQKQILNVLANKVRNAICGEIGDAKFCIIIDEARDESKREQMSIVLRLVDKDGYVQERFFRLVHVEDTAALT